MNVDAFVADRSPTWERLETLVRDAGKRPERLGPDGVRELGVRYRETVADLALARHRYPADPAVRRLERLVTNARHLVYDSEPRRGAVRDFVSHGYWRRIRERPVPLLVAVLFLFAPALLAGMWAWRDPGAASGLVPSQYQRVTEPRPSNTDLGVSVSDQAALASQIFTNNITVTMLAFGGGLLLGLGTVLVLVQNGVLLGVVAGLSIGAGNGRPFFALITAHGVLELSCICVAAAAGLRIGWAIVDPGYRRRGEALREEARAAIEMILGTAPWLVVAGLVEGFITPAGLGLPTVLTIGIALGAVFWGLVLWRGKPATVTTTTVDAGI
ncbi:MAG TPA: stage II sporulation protein M [Acidimicrobiia bacterium]|jgi:uncharacterized membrane protein SpoIIM required for sporulation|nr:stage II sporulation protein M [Acidimicrobiia bacterium]